VRCLLFRFVTCSIYSPFNLISYTFPSDDKELMRLRLQISGGHLVWEYDGRD
jgi:hypothetical protein